MHSVLNYGETFTQVVHQKENIFHVHVNAIGNLADKYSFQGQGDTSNSGKFQWDQNQKNEPKNLGHHKQKDLKENNEKNLYHRQFPKISSNIEK